MTSLQQLRDKVDLYNQNKELLIKEIIETQSPGDNRLFTNHVLFDKDWSQIWATDEFLRLSDPEVFTKDVDEQGLVILTPEMRVALGFKEDIDTDAYLRNTFECENLLKEKGRYDNFVIAGGSVVDMLLGRNNKESDCDIFCYSYERKSNPGIPGKFEPQLDIDQLVKDVEATFGLTYCSFTKKSINFRADKRSPNGNKIYRVVTLLRQRYQIIRSVYRSILQILLGFDLDCACVAFDGVNFLATNRFIKSWQTKTNLVDPGRYGGSYLYRMKKYMDRYEIKPHVVGQVLGDDLIGKRQNPRFRSSYNNAKHYIGVLVKQCFMKALEYATLNITPNIHDVFKYPYNKQFATFLQYVGHYMKDKINAPMIKFLFEDFDYFMTTNAIGGELRHLATHNTIHGPPKFSNDSQAQTFFVGIGYKVYEPIFSDMAKYDSLKLLPQVPDVLPTQQGHADGLTVSEDTKKLRLAVSVFKYMIDIFTVTKMKTMIEQVSEGLEILEKILPAIKIEALFLQHLHEMEVENYPISYDLFTVLDKLYKKSIEKNVFITGQRNVDLMINTVRMLSFKINSMGDFNDKCRLRSHSYYDYSKTAFKNYEDIIEMIKVVKEHCSRSEFALYSSPNRWEALYLRRPKRDIPQGMQGLNSRNMSQTISVSPPMSNFIPNTETVLPDPGAVFDSGTTLPSSVLPGTILPGSKLRLTPHSTEIRSQNFTIENGYTFNFGNEKNPLPSYPSPSRSPQGSSLSGSVGIEASQLSQLSQDKLESEVPSKDLYELLYESIREDQERQVNDPDFHFLVRLNVKEKLLELMDIDLDAIKQEHGDPIRTIYNKFVAEYTRLYRKLVVRDWDMTARNLSRDPTNTLYNF